MLSFSCLVDRMTLWKVAVARIHFSCSTLDEADGALLISISLQKPAAHSTDFFKEKMLICSLDKPASFCACFIPDILPLSLCPLVRPCFDLHFSSPTCISCNLHEDLHQACITSLGWFSEMELSATREFHRKLVSDIFLH